LRAHYYVGGSLMLRQMSFEFNWLSKEVISLFHLTTQVTFIIYGNRGCEVRKVVIQKNERFSRAEKILPQIIFRQSKVLSIVLKYYKTLAIWDAMGILMVRVLILSSTLKVG
jgi:hypothetical protein